MKRPVNFTWRVLMQYRYRIVDVFTRQALQGNPLGVFPDAPALDQLMTQKFAREWDLSETTFVLPATRPGLSRAHQNIHAQIRNDLRRTSDYRHEFRLAGRENDYTSR